jgi:hypothetical protein
MVLSSWSTSAGGGNGLNYEVDLFDATGTSDPQHVSRYATWGWASRFDDIAMLGPIVFASRGHELAIVAYDTEAPPPHWASDMSLPEPAGMAISGSHLVVADPQAGLIVLDPSCVVPLFRDRFESGDLTTWSVTVPQKEAVHSR